MRYFSRNRRYYAALVQAHEEAEREKNRLIEKRRQLIAAALKRQRKQDLIEVLGKLCDANVHARWIIETHFAIAKPVEVILHDLREAIRLATKVDEQRLNDNFDFDYDAYAEVKRLFETLLALGALREAGDIAVQFMGDASHQIASSDEGMMLDEVKECLQPVLAAMKGMEVTERAAWAQRMQRADVVGFVCSDILSSWSNSRSDGS